MPCYHKSMSTFLCSLLFYSLDLLDIDMLSQILWRHHPRLLPPRLVSFAFVRPFQHAFPTPKTRVRPSLSRKSWLTAALHSTSTKALVCPISRVGYEYLVKIKVGTPPVEQLAITDTGSDLTWIQCKPCIHCYNQTLPLFDPSHSLSYRPVSCGSHHCTASSGSCGSKNTCQYEFHAADGSYSYGELATETLTFDGGVSFPNLAFGCGRENGYPISINNVSGIVGLGAGSTSIINQLKNP